MIVLDTHVWIWLCVEPGRLSRPATVSIRRATGNGGLAVASISLLEVARLAERGRIIAHGTVASWLDELVDRSNVTVKEITPVIAAIAAHLPNDFPGDPADRLIAATARAEGAPLVTRDAAIKTSRLVETIW